MPLLFQTGSSDHLHVPPVLPNPNPPFAHLPRKETIAYLLSQKVLPSSVDPSKVTFRIQGMLVPEEVWKEVLEGEERREWSTGLEMEVGWDEPVEGGEFGRLEQIEKDRAE